jgi:RimJ/RimL family protein N-acetyltransferase
MQLTDADLTLRPWRPDDAEAFWRAVQDPLIERYTSLRAPYGLSDARKFVAETAPAGWASGMSANFAVVDSASGELLGSCGLVWISAGMAELGYWTTSAARGRGVALRASRLVCRYAFEELGIQRIIWQAAIGNHASRLVALRAGFHVDGTWQFRDPHPLGPADGWVATLLPGQLTEQTPQRYATGSLVARRTEVLSTGVPVLDLPEALGRLRAPAEADIDAITAGCQDPRTARWTTVPVPYTRADSESFVRGRVATGWALGTALTFAIADPGDTWVGSIDLRLHDPEATTAEVGYLVAPGARGRGLASAALRTLAAWGFDTFGLHRVVWRAEVGNEASRRVAEKAGFQVEGIQRGGMPARDGDGFRDAWVGGLLATDPR